VNLIANINQSLLKQTNRRVYEVGHMQRGHLTADTNVSNVEKSNTLLEQDGHHFKMHQWQPPETYQHSAP